MKKVLSVLLVIIMLTGVLTGCQNTQAPSGEAGKNTGTSNGTAKPVPEEKTKVRILHSGTGTIPPEIDPQKNKWADMYAEAFPFVEFEWLLEPSGTVQQKRSLMVASGDLPDIMQATQSELIKWSEGGVIQPLDDVLKKYYPNITKFIGPDDLKLGQYNGKTWALLTPISTIENPSGLHIRKDWMENLGLKAPETIDQLYEIYKAFTSNDPDKNGKNDTFGLGSQSGLGGMEQIFLAYDVNPGFWSRVNGKLVPDSVRPEMKTALSFIRKLYAEGLYDKDSLVANYSQYQSKLTSGIYGTATFNASGIGGTVNPALKKTSPNAEFIAVPPPKGPNGKMGTPRGRSVHNRYVASVNFKKPEILGRILNYMLEQDTSKPYVYYNMDKFNCGEVGVHSTIADKYIMNIPAGNLQGEALKDQYRFVYRFLMGSSNSLPDDHMIKVAEARVSSGIQTASFADTVKNAVKYSQYDERIISGPVEAEYMGELTTYFNEIKAKIVTGAEPLDAFEKWVDYFYKNNGQKIVDEANKLNPAK